MGENKNNRIRQKPNNKKWLMHKGHINTIIINGSVFVCILHRQTKDVLWSCSGNQLLWKGKCFQHRLGIPSKSKIYIYICFPLSDSSVCSKCHISTSFEINCYMLIFIVNYFIFKEHLTEGHTRRKNIPITRFRKI